MKKLAFLSIAVLFAIPCWLGCKKQPPALPPNHNEFKATVVLVSGSTVTINAAGAKAKMGCAPWGGGTYVNGTSETNARVYCSAYSSGIACVIAPGTYQCSCEYRPDATSSTTPGYGSTAAHPGSITFTVFDANHMEGYFDAVCTNNTDSVVVSGTFKGDYFK